MLPSYLTRKGVYRINDLKSKTIAANTSSGVNTAALAANNQRQAAIIKASSSVMVKNRVAAIEAAQGLAQQISTQRAAAATTSARQNAVNMSNMYLSVVGAGSTQGNVQRSLKTVGTKSKKASWQEALNSGRISRGIAASENPKYAVKERYIDDIVDTFSPTPVSTTTTHNRLVGKTTASNKKSNTASYYDVDSSLADIYSQATSAGVSIGKPSKYGTAVTDAKKAQAIIDDYLAKANTAIAASNASILGTETVYDVADQYNEIYNSGKNYGVTIAKPTQTQFKTQAAAQAALDSYVSQVNKALEKAPAPTYTNIDPQKTSGYAYTVTLSHAQQNELIRRNQTRKQQGKTELSEFEFRQEKGISTETTQGSYVKPKLTNNSYSSAGTGSSTIKAVKDTGSSKKIAASIGSGDIKLAQIKSSSSVNNNSSAKTDTAQQGKAVVISAAEAKKIQSASTAQKQAAATQATAAAKLAAQQLKDIQAEATAKAKAATKAAAAVNKTTSTTAKAAAKAEASKLQKAAEAAKNAVKAAKKSAQATSELAKATAKAASAVFGTRASAAASKAVVSKAAKAEAATKAASKAGVQDHTGQILLKDGTWINPIQKKGSTGVGEKSIKIFGTTKEYQAQLEQEYKKKSAGRYVRHSLNPVYAKALAETKQAKINEAAEAKRLAAAYAPTLAITGEVIDAIQSKSLHGTGEAGVKIIKLDKNNNITASSKTAKQLHEEKKFFNKEVKLSDGTTTTLDQIPITSATDKSTARAIQEARAYQIAHTSNANKMGLQIEYAGLDGQLSAPKSKTSFKTTDQIRQEKLMKSNNKLVRSLVKADVAFRNAGNYDNVVKKGSETLDNLNAQFSEVLNIPSLNKVQKVRDQFLGGLTVKVTQPGKAVREYTALDVHKKYQDKIYGNKYGAAIEDFGTSTYESVRTKPVTAGLYVAALYASGAVTGAAIEGGLGIAARGAAGVAAKASSKVVKKAASVTAKHVQGAGRGALTAGVAYEGAKTVASGNAADTVRFVSSLAVGGLGYSKGAKIVKDPISIIPGARTTKLQAVSSGHDTTVIDISAGESFSIGGKTLLSRTREGKFVKGAPAVDSTLTKGKIIQSFDKGDTATFRKTVENQASKDDLTIFDTGKKISDVAYALKNPVTNPKKFEILSEHISSNMKSVVKDTIVSSKDVEVYGSVAQKLQLKDFMNRTPQDLDVSAGNVEKFVTVFKTKAEKAGFKEGVDYKINRAKADAPKIEFKVNGKWEKGIEVFSSKSPKASETQGYRSEDRIAFGYNSLKPLKVDSTKLMKLQEQATRKHAGATTLQDNSLAPVHPGRSKDVIDLIEIGVANEVTFKTGIAKEIILYAQLQAAKGLDFDKSTIATFIAKQGRMPSKAELEVLTTDSLKESEMGTLVKRASTLEPQLTKGSKAAKSLRSLRKLRKGESSVKSKSPSQAKSAQDKNSVKPKFRQNERKVGNVENELIYSSRAASKSARIQRSSRAVSRSISRRSVGAEVSKALEITSPSKLASKAAKSRALSSKSMPSKPLSSTSVSKPISSKATNSKPSKAVSTPSRAAHSKAPTSRDVSKAPSKVPSKVPSKAPLKAPSRKPSEIPSKAPSKVPSKAPSKRPSKSPSKRPSKMPSKTPSKVPSKPTSSSSLKRDYIMYSQPDPDHWHLPSRTRRGTARMDGLNNKTTEGKRDTSRTKFHRNIRNTLGGLSSMLGSETSKVSSRAVRTSSKEVSKTLRVLSGHPVKPKTKQDTRQSTVVRRNSFKPSISSSYVQNSRKSSTLPSKPSNSKRTKKEEISPSVSKIKNDTTVSKTINSKTISSKTVPSKSVALELMDVGSARSLRTLSDGFKTMKSVRHDDFVRKKKLKKAIKGQKPKTKREKLHRNIKNTLGNMNTFLG